MICKWVIQSALKNISKEQTSYALSVTLTCTLGKWFEPLFHFWVQEMLNGIGTYLFWLFLIIITDILNFGKCRTSTRATIYWFKMFCGWCTDFYHCTLHQLWPSNSCKMSRCLYPGWTPIHFSWHYPRVHMFVWLRSI